MLARLRTYRFLPALLTLALLSSFAVPLVQEVCAMQMQAQPMMEHEVPGHETSGHGHQATSQTNPAHAADRCHCNHESKRERETPPCHPVGEVSLEASCCEITPAGTETWALPPVAPQQLEVALAVLAATTDAYVRDAAPDELPLGQTLVDPPPSPPARLLFSVFLI